MIGTKFQNIQALRAIAALLVLMAHLQFSVRGANPSIQVPKLLTSTGGGWGVDIFFVISGFVISLAADRKHLGASRFLRNRIARIVPIYAVISFFCLLLALIKGKAPSFSAL